MKNLKFLDSFSKIPRYQIQWKTWSFSTVFQKYSGIKFNENPAQWEPSCSMQPEEGKDGRTNMMKLIVTFRNFANASKKCHSGLNGKTTCEESRKQRLESA